MELLSKYQPPRQSQFIFIHLLSVNSIVAALTLPVPVDTSKYNLITIIQGFRSACKF